MNTKEILKEYNDYALPYPSDKTIVDMFEAQVKQTPESIAFVYQDCQFTYRKVNEKSNQIAHFLRQQKEIKQNDLVGVMLSRSATLVITLLGVLKAGAAYVPLDPEYPTKRLKYIIEDSGLNLIISEKTQEEQVDRLLTTTIYIDQISGPITQYSDANPPKISTTHDLIYVIYTSGSTGRPKGIQVIHKSVVNFMTSMVREPGMDKNDKLLAVTTCNFDISVLELFLPLMTGACVVIASQDQVREPVLLEQLIESASPTIMQATPSLWTMLIENGWLGNRKLKVLCGGERLPIKLGKKLLDRSGSLWNMYGPTEATIWSTVKSIANESDLSCIGKPIANTTIYILDDTLKLVPKEVIGEMYIGGDGLAKGYLNRDELTKEKFVTNPFEEGKRLYRTGDLGKWLEDGSIAFIGRNDEQVKIRGHRVELGEIESVIYGHELVQKVVLIQQQDHTGETNLIAYIVPEINSIDDNITEINKEINQEQVTGWSKVWDEAYKSTHANHDQLFNTSGWNSSYTGLAIPEDEMRDFINEAVDLVRSYNPKNVFEIGCGTGLMLFEIAPHCTQFIGSDISQSAIDYIKQQIEQNTDNWEQVELFQGSAIEFGFLKDKNIDTIILNSVIQYFPGIEYLEKVLERAIDLIQAGGIIFVGDVRSFSLYPLFQTSVQLHQAEGTTTGQELNQKIRENIIKESELLIDPGFFILLKKRYPKISHVEILPKTSKYENELSKFRYQVIIHIGPTIEVHEEINWVNWQKENQLIPFLETLLKERGTEIIGLKNIPNHQLVQDRQVYTWLQNKETQVTATELKATKQLSEDVIKLDDLNNLAAALSYETKVFLENDIHDGGYDILFRKKASHNDFMDLSRIYFKTIEREFSDNQLICYGSDPLKSKLNRRLVPLLNSHLKEELPDYMMPSGYVFVESFPQTLNGKIDRNALVEIGNRELGIIQEYTAPQNETAKKLATLWQEILGRDMIGAKDNFFELGGHSLKATQLTSRIHKEFNTRIDLKSVFTHPTVEMLSDLIHRAAKTA